MNLSPTGTWVQVDESQQTLKIHADEDRVWKRTAPSPTLARLQKHMSPERFISASMLAFKAKQFDDGLSAAVDLAAQHGAGKYPGKISLFTELTKLLVRGGLYGEMSAVVFAAGRLGGISVEQPSVMEPAVAGLIERFLADESESKALGFYSWTQELERIFQQDRMLQTPVRDLRALDEVARALRECGSACATYADYLTLVSRLTNPLVAADLRDWSEHPASDDTGPWSFLPPSRAYETDLARQLYQSTPIEEGFSLVQEMVQRIRAGRLFLKPTKKSGWYDYQTWALEPLVLPERMPEDARLKFSREYQDHLVELFKGMIALTRETHVKQLEGVITGATPRRTSPRKEIHVSPRLSLEPLREFYGRRAIAYSFVRQILVDTFGPDGLKKMRRMTPHGPVELPLEDELEQMVALFRGAHGCVNRQLALSPIDVMPQLPDLSAAVSTFQDWASGLDNDLDLGRDPRMMVPIFYDVERKKTKVWVVLGWEERPLWISYATRPMVHVKDKNGRAVDKELDVKFSGQYVFAAYPVSAEVYVSRLLNREEFQKHCDQYETGEEILTKLM